MVKARLYPFLLALLTLVSVAASPDPDDNGTGLTYDTLTVTVLAQSDVVAGELASIVLRAVWSDGMPASAAKGGVLAHWPPLSEYEARATDAVAFSATRADGTYILTYRTPAEVLREDETSVAAELDLWVLAFRDGFPRVGWGKLTQPVVVTRG